MTKPRALILIISLAFMLSFSAGCSPAADADMDTTHPDSSESNSTLDLDTQEHEPQIIHFGDSGISIILPDWWEGRYEIEYGDSSLTVYHPASRELGTGYGGILFGMGYTDELYPLDYSWPVPGFVVAVSEAGTYYFGKPSDVQFDHEDAVSSAEYLELFNDIKNIKIVMPVEMAENSARISGSLNDNTGQE